MIAVVASIAASAGVVAVGGVLLQSDGTAAPPTTPARPDGPPPLQLDLGVRTDEEAVELRRAAQLVADGRRRDAARVFARYRSLEARVGLALARWPDGSVPMLRALAREYPRSALVRLNLGFALFWSGARAQGVEEWKEAERVEPDSLSAVRADDLLHPNAPRGLPVFVPSRQAPPRIASLPPARQVAALAADAKSGGTPEKLRYGVALQRLGKPVSARRQFDAAAALTPDDPDALVAAAVARFDKDDPARAFSRLGPLARRFPGEPTVRFHLGLLLLWTGAVDEAEDQLRRAAAIDPADPLAREASRFLARLAEAGTS
jgi:predicted Zn-dependent protease